VIRRRVVPVLVLSTVATVAAAQASPRTKTTAQALSGVGVAASGALFLSAFVVSERDGDVNLPLLYVGLGSSIITPSLGYFYLGDYLTLGMGIRVGAAALASFAVVQYSQPVRCPSVEFDVSCKGLEREAVVLLGLAAIALVGGAAYDVKELPGKVDDHNRQHGITVGPSLIPSTTGAPGAGVVLGGSW
jgi:hypothetical protein